MTADTNRETTTAPPPPEAPLAAKAPLEEQEILVVVVDPQMQDDGPAKEETTQEQGLASSSHHGSAPETANTKDETAPPATAKPEQPPATTTNYEYSLDSQGREFPDAFYDPITGKLMTDPVVNPSGDSFDRSTVEDQELGIHRDENGEEIVFYPNRALHSLLDRAGTALTSQGSSSSLRDMLMRLDENARTQWGKLVEMSAFGGGAAAATVEAAANVKPLPDVFYCTITCELMTDPVIDPEGNSFERQALENWINSQHGVSPLTRNPLRVENLRRNNALYDLIQREKKRRPQRHPSISRWEATPGLETSRRLSLSDRPPPPNAPLQVEEEPDAAEQPTIQVNSNFQAMSPQAELAAQAAHARRMQQLKTCALLGILLAFVVIILLFPQSLFLGFVGLLICIIIAGRGLRNANLRGAARARREAARAQAPDPTTGVTIQA